MDISQFEIAAPAAPGNGATITLVDTTKWSPGGVDTTKSMKVIPVMGINRIIVTFLSIDQASAANGLVGYGSSNGGTNFDQIQAGATVNVTSAAVQAFDYLVDPYDDVRILYTAGATGPTVWRVTIKAIVGQRHVGT